MVRSSIIDHGRIVLANGVDMFLQRQPRQLVNWQAREQLDPSSQDKERVTKRTAPLGVGRRDRRRVRDAPMRGHRLARPKGTRLSRGLVTYGEDEMQWRRIRFSKLVPALASQPFGRHVMLLQDLEREGIDGALRMTSRAERPKLTPGDAGMIGERLRHDRPRRVAGAEEQDVQHVYLDSASRGKRSGLSVKSASTPRLPR
jgi:hypothetical protein